jgi:hypothetical protein
MRLHTSYLVLALTAALVAPASAQVSGPPTVPPAGNMYTPIYGGTAGIAIPVGRLSDDHAAGYLFGALVEYGVTGQPYALRGELLYQRFALKSGRTTGNDIGLWSLGSTIVYKMQQSPTNTFVTGGIAIYHGNEGLGTRPGANVGTGIEIPLTGFSATGEARLHLMLADGRPVITVPLTVAVRF